MANDWRCARAVPGLCENAPWSVCSKIRFGIGVVATPQCFALPFQPQQHTGRVPMQMECRRTPPHHRASPPQSNPRTAGAFSRWRLSPASSRRQVARSGCVLCYNATSIPSPPPPYLCRADVTSINMATIGCHQRTYPRSRMCWMLNCRRDFCVQGRVLEEPSLLFCFVLFCFVLFCFVLFCFVFRFFCFLLFSFVFFCFLLFSYPPPPLRKHRLV